MAKYGYLLLLTLLLGTQTVPAQQVKYASQMKKYLTKSLSDLPITYYYDYNEALAAGKKENKPVMLYFTGIYAINCRKMESMIWGRENVRQRIKDNFIVALLYCDLIDVKLPANEQVYSKVLHKKMENLRDVNSDLEVSKFGSNAQPSYYFVDGDGKKVVNKGYSYDPDVTKFMNLLDVVSATYNKKAGK